MNPSTGTSSPFGSFPTQKDLIESSVRSALSTQQVVTFLMQVDENLSDEHLMDGLRRWRNIFGQGGADLNLQINWMKYEKKLNNFFHSFVRERWRGGLSILLQLIHNMCHPIRFVGDDCIDEGGTLLQIGEHFDSHMISFFAAALLRCEKSYWEKENKTMLKGESISAILLYLIEKFDEIGHKEGWISLLFNHFWVVSPEVFCTALEKSNSEILPPLLEFITDQMTENPVGLKTDDSDCEFPIVILDNIREYFLLHCNCILLPGPTNKELENRDLSKSIIFEVLKFIAPASARHTAPFATEPMLVAICGIMKRCWEISQNPKYKDELRPRLQDGGELPQRSAYIEIMFEIWKNTVRILANILGHHESERKKEMQDEVRALGAIPAVLAAAGTLHTNQIRPWAIQAIDQLTKNNLENQAEISSLKNMGKVDHDDVTVDREDGKFHFKRIQLDKKDAKKENIQ